MNLIERFEIHYSDKRDNTLINYKSDIRKFFEFASNHLNIEPTNDIEIVEKSNWELCSFFKADMVRKNLSPKTINRCLISLVKFFDMCLRLDDINISSNPFKDVEKVSTKACKTTRGFLLEDDIELLLQAIETRCSGDRNFEFNSKRDLLLYALIITCGLRISEALSLEFEDIDVELMQVYVIDGKGGKNRTVAIDSYITELLEDYLLLRSKVVAENNKLVFVSIKGKALTVASSNKNLKKYCERAGIETKTNHELRHTYATISVLRGMDLESLRTSLGHTSLTTTSIYTHTTVDQARAYVGIKRKS